MGQKDPVKLYRDIIQYVSHDWCMYGMCFLAIFIDFLCLNMLVLQIYLLFGLFNWGDDLL